MAAAMLHVFQKSCCNDLLYVSLSAVSENLPFQLCLFSLRPGHFISGREYLPLVCFLQGYTWQPEAVDRSVCTRVQNPPHGALARTNLSNSSVTRTRLQNQDFVSIKFNGLIASHDEFGLKFPPISLVEG